MIARPLDRAGLCVCGVSVALHFDAADRKQSCAFAAWRLSARPAAPQRTGVVLPFTLTHRADAPADLDHTARVAK